MQSDNNHHLNNFFVLTLAFTTFLLGFLLGKLPLLNIANNNSEQQPQALNQLPELLLPPIPDEIFSVSGQIKTIENNVISLEIVSLVSGFTPGVAPKMEIRKITVTKEAKITKFNPFVFPEIDKKTGEIKPPKQEVVKLSDLKIGDRITATAKENIKTKMEFEAVEIQLQILPELPSAPALPPAPLQ